MPKKIEKALKHLSLSKIGGRSRANLQVLFGASLELREPTAEVLAAMASFAAAPASMQPPTGGVSPGQVQQGDVFPNEQTDYIYPKFRVLSATIIPGYFIDFSKPDVLKESMAVLAQQTLYANHVYWNVRDWVGVVNSVTWDDKADAAGAPGINSEMKVDWRKAPEIARGLLMKPPAVKAVSATVDFEWDASHPDLLEQGIFWRNLGQDIDDQVVRMIVTKITDYYEVSFVYKGANPGSNGMLPEDDEGDEEFSAPQLSATKPTVLPLKPKETKKMKFNAVLIAALAALGINVAADEEVAEERVQTLLADLSARATAADPIVSTERAEVLRLATLVEGTGEGDARKLPESLSGIIEKADASQLPGLRKLYQDKFDAALPMVCSHGHKATSRRSSVEDVEVVKEETASAAANVPAYPGL